MFESTRGLCARNSISRHLLRSMLPLILLTPAASAAGQETAQIESAAGAESGSFEEIALATFEEVWSIINETHFDPQHLEKIGWEQAREEFRPLAAQARSNEELRPVIGDMLSRLEQSHFALIPAEAAEAMEPDDGGEAEEERDADQDLSETLGRNESSSEDGSANPTAADADDDEDALDESRSAPDGQNASEDDGENNGGTPGTIGIRVRWRDGRFLITKVDPGSPAEQAGIRSGWILQNINGKELNRLVEEFPDDLSPQWLRVLAWGTAHSRLDGVSGKQITATFIDGNDVPVELTIRREPERGEPSKFGNTPTMFARVETESLATEAGHSAGLIAFNVWMTPVMHPMREAIDRFRGMDGIIIDLRGNPGGIGGLAMGVAGFFVDERQKFGTMKTRGGELNFVAFPQRLSAAGELVEPYAGLVALLVDDITGSTSEVFAGGMQSVGRVRVFGTTTMGATLPAMMPRLANGDVLMHAFGDFVDANGERMEGRGVIPDEEVQLDRTALLEGEDPVVEAALSWIDENARQ